jgi:hypothetical protein
MASHPINHLREPHPTSSISDLVSRCTFPDIHYFIMPVLASLKQAPSWQLSTSVSESARTAHP